MTNRIITPYELEVRRELELRIPKERLEVIKEEVEKEYQKKVQLRGFRLGHAPIQLVREHFKERIKDDTRERVIKDEIIQELKFREINPVSQIQIKREEDDPEGGILLTLEFEVIPKFDFPSLGSLKVKRKIKRVHEGEIEEEIKKLRQSLAEYRPLDRETRDGDYLLLDFTQKTKEGKMVKEEQGIFLPLDFSSLSPKLYHLFKGKRKGEVASMEADGFVYTYKIVALKEEKLPLLDDEFARTLGFNDLTALREHLREEVTKKKQEESEHEFEWELIQELYNRVRFQIPASLITREIEFLKNGINPKLLLEVKDYEKELQKLACDYVTRDIILERFVQLNDLGITEEELEHEMENSARGYKVDLSVYRKELKKKNGIVALKNRLLKAKAMEMLKSQVTMEVEIE